MILKKLPALVKEGWPRFADGVVRPAKVLKSLFGFIHDSISSTTPSAEDGCHPS